MCTGPFFQAVTFHGVAQAGGNWNNWSSVGNPDLLWGPHDLPSKPYRPVLEAVVEVNAWIYRSTAPWHVRVDLEIAA